MKSDRYNAAAFFAFALYSLVWSDISITRFVNLQATILDLGANMQIAWDVLHNPGSYFSVLPQSHGSLLPWILIFLPGTYWFALIFQSVWIGLGSLPLFWIARRRLGDRVALVISCLYLTYFPLAGPNWFDFHVETLFPTIFLFGYYLHMRGSAWASVTVMALAALIRFPYTVFPLIFSGIELYRNRLIREDAAGAWRRPLPYYILLLFCISVSGYFVYYVARGSVGSLLSSYYVGSSLGSSQAPPLGSFVSVSAPLNFTFSHNVYLLDVIRTFALYFAPLIFLPLVSYRWWPYYLPYLAIMLLSGYAGLYYPLVFVYQYPAMLAPFVFLGFTDVLGVLQTKMGKRQAAVPSEKLRFYLPHTLKRFYATPHFRRKNRRGGENDVPRHAVIAGSKAHICDRSGPLGAILILAILSSAVFASVYEPYGPLNRVSPVPLNWSPVANWESFNEFERLLSLVPNGSNLLVQDNMPEVFPTQLHGLSLAVDTAFWSYYQSGANLSAINAILIDPGSPWFVMENPQSYGYSMYSALLALWQTGDFGVVGEAQGMALLARGYCGPLKYYIPLNQSIRVTQLYEDPANPFNGGYAGMANYTLVDSEYFGPDFYYPPGNYLVTLVLPDRLSGNFTMALSVTSASGNSILASKLFSFRNDQGRRQELSVYFDSTPLNWGVQFRVSALNLNGSLIPVTLQLEQLSAFTSPNGSTSSLCDSVNQAGASGT